MTDYLNSLHEAIIRDKEEGQDGWDKLLGDAKRNHLYTKLLKEGLTADLVGAVGNLQNVVWKAAEPKFISREIINAMPTKNALEKFPRDIRAYAWVGEGNAPDTGARTDTVTVEADPRTGEISAKKDWSESYLEDASWNVLEWQIKAIGKGVARKETELVIAMYNAIANADLATGAEFTITDGAPTWAQIVDLANAVQREDFGDSVVVAMNPHEWGGLMKLDQFVSSLYEPSEKSMRKGVFYHTKLDVNFVRSSLITKSLAVDVENAAAMIIRRDVRTKPYEDPAKGTEGVRGSERIGMGVIRSKAVARGTN